MSPTPKRAGLVITDEFNLFHIWIILGLVSKLACFWSLSGQAPAHPPLSGEEKVWWRARHGLESVCSSNQCGLHTYLCSSNVIFLSKYPHLYFPQSNRSFYYISSACANILTMGRGLSWAQYSWTHPCGSSKQNTPPHLSATALG